MRCQQIWSAACRELPLPFKLGFAAGAATFGALCHTRKQPGVSNGAGGFAPHSNFRVPCCRAPLFHQKSQPLKGLGFGPQKVQLGNFKVWLRRVN
jgi:hypothetical protein